MYKFFDIKLKSHINTIFVGECCIGGGNEIVCTVLGSCIAICLHDTQLLIGGMIHYLLPESSLYEKLDDNPLSYGDSSIEFLIHELILRGSDRETLVAKIFGGSNISHINTKKKSIGLMNIKAAENILKKENIKILSRSIGEDISRKVYFFPGNNKVFLKEVK